MLKVYNSLGRSLQEFKPVKRDFAGIYVCGPTVYGHSHIGHAKSYVSFDVIVRYLRHSGYRVRYVQNITDVGHLSDDADEGEDKIIKKARETGLQPMEVAEAYTKSYFDDMDALNVLRPDISPRASGHIPEQIEMISKLIENGHAYEVGSNVYYDITTFPEYGKLSGRDLADLMEGVRVETREEKRNPADFALWKRADENHIMRWNSPWGTGFPGWHLECSAMALKYLGPELDIHGGGLENMFPHHEDEIAQAEGVTGINYARYWLHNNMVTVDGQKMGKSLGNFITLKDAFAGEPPLEKKIRPMVLRYFILNSHYRSPLDFSSEALESAEKGLGRIENACAAIRRRLAQADSGGADEVPEAVSVSIENVREGFRRAMDEDFNTAEALGELSKFTRDVNKYLASAHETNTPALQALETTYRQLGEDVLGILRDSREKAVSATGASIEKELIETMIVTRTTLRKQGNYQMADQIRDRLKELGIELKDGPSGTEWERD